MVSSSESSKKSEGELWGGVCSDGFSNPYRFVLVVVESSRITTSCRGGSEGVVWLIPESITELQQSTNVSELNALSKNCGYPNRLIWNSMFIDDQTHIEIVIYVI